MRSRPEWVSTTLNKGLPMTRDEIQEAIAKLTADERARLRAWLDRFEGEQRAAPAETAAERLGRMAGRTFSELRRRVRE